MNGQSSRGRRSGVYACAPRDSGTGCVRPHAINTSPRRPCCLAGGRAARAAVRNAAPASAAACPRSAPPAARGWMWRPRPRSGGSPPSLLFARSRVVQARELARLHQQLPKVLWRRDDAWPVRLDDHWHLLGSKGPGRAWHARRLSGARVGSERRPLYGVAGVHGACMQHAWAMEPRAITGMAYLAADALGSPPTGHHPCPTPCMRPPLHTSSLGTRMCAFSTSDSAPTPSLHTNSSASGSTARPPT